MQRVKVLLAVMGLVFMLMASLSDASQRLVMMEVFTSTTCGYCPDSNQRITQILSEHPDMLAVVRYHVWWPQNTDPFYRYNTSESTTRTQYYGVQNIGVPFSKIGGFLDGTNYESYWTIIQNRYYMDAAVEIELTGGYNAEERNGRLDINLTATDFADFSELYVRVALTESNIYYRGPNGENYHYQVMRDMIPTAIGTPIDIEYGGSVDLSIPFNIPSEFVAENCELVVWLQTDNIQITEVLQAAKIAPLSLGPVSVDDEVELPLEFNLAQNYPNPFNATTSISYTLSSNSSVELTVYDIAGRQVAKLVNGVESAGEHQVVWHGLNDSGEQVSTGIYFYNLKTDSENSTKRMILLK